MSIEGLTIDLDGDVPVYRQIAEGVKLAARDGRLGDAARLPATRDLARHLGVNRNTVIAAYDELAAQGWTNSHTGRGTFLVSPQPGGELSPESDDAWFTAFSRAAEGVEPGGLESILSMSVSGDGISFVGSYPAAELLPVEGFSRAIQTALDERGAQALSYGPTAGLAELRETIAGRMSSAGAEVSADEILITHGAQQALDLSLRAFLDPGDTILMEEPTYTGVLSVLSSLGARGVGIPMDEDGLRPDYLAIALQRHRPKLIYLQPNFQNPTTALIPEARRREILALARQYRVPVVEDDWSGDLRLDGDPVPSFYALDGGRHVIHLSSFSKMLMPGLRLGWVAAPRSILARLVALKRVQDCGSSPLLQAALHAFLRDGGLERHLERIRDAYRQRRDCMLQALQRHFPQGTSWTEPSGGLFLWVALPQGFDGAELFVAARQRGVLYSRGDLFHTDGSGGNRLRLTYSSVGPEQIEAGIAILGELVAERMKRLEPLPSDAMEAIPIL